MKNKVKLTVKKKVLIDILVLVMAISLLPVIPAFAADQGALPFGKTVSGNITETNDVDIYSVVLPQPGKLTVRLMSKISYIGIQWLDNNYQEIKQAWINVGSPSSPKIYEETMDLETGTYYLRVYKDRSTTGTYDLTTTFSPANNNEIEPNDGPEQAQLLSSGQSVTGFISYQDDMDYYRIVLNQSGKLTVRLTSKISYIGIQWLDNNYQEMKQDWINVGSPLSPRIYEDAMDLEAGTYYLRVYKDRDTTGTYDLTTTFSPVNNNEIEPNNIPEQAQLLNIGQSVTGFISYQDDNDYYRVVLNSAEKLNVRLISRISYLGIQWLDNNYQEIKQAWINVGSPSSPKIYEETRDINAGIYYIRVYKDRGTTGIYDLMVTFDGDTMQSAPGESTSTNNTTENSPSPAPAYVYDEADPGAAVAPPYDQLANITDQSSAVQVVTNYINTLTTAQKQSPTGADRVALFCEAAIARVASTAVSGDIVIDKALVTGLQSQADATKAALQSTLDSGGVLNLRDLRTTVTVDYSGSTTANISVNADYSDANADVVKVDAGFASLYMNKGQVATTDITLQNQGANKVGVDFSNTNSKSIVTVSFPDANASDAYAAVVDASGAAVGGKYNPATNSIEARISGSGTYTVKDNPKDFADIKNKSAEMQSAIKLLASKGIINGTSDTAFSPDATISRAEVAALIIRMLGRLDPNADGGFSDVARSAWYYGVAGSSRDYGLINGYEDNTFRATVAIPKDQIFAVEARVLRQEMGYATPADLNKYLPYADASSIPAWARDDLAVATMANLVMRRTDGTFDPNEQMTRGDAAIGVMRLYEKIW